LRSTGLTAICLLAGAVSFAQDDPQAKAQRAKQAMIGHRYEEAARLYSELVREVPGNPGLFLNLGLAQHSAGHYREAVESFSSALKLKPDFTQARFLIGVAYQKLGEPTKAIGPLQETLDADTGNRLARLELADALLSTGRFHDSARHFQKLTQLDPADARCWQGLGFSYLGLARRAFEKLEEAAPDSGYVYALLANSRKEQQQTRSAFALYRKALEANPELPGIHSAIADIYRHSGHDEWAAVEDERERALPTADCSSARAQCAFLAGRYEQAIEPEDTPWNLYWKNRSYGELARAALARLGQLPSSPQVHELLAEAYRAQGQLAEAAQEIREALKLDPESARLQSLLAAELWRGRDYHAAQPIFEKLLAANPDSADLNYELGDLFLQQQEPEKALPLLEKAVRLKAGLLPAHASLARALVQCGHPEAAISHFDAALPLDEDGQLHFQLSRAAQRAGRLELAREALQQYQAISQASAARKKLMQDEQEILPPK
jgi:tetratricopeptide (TPR) repeat protein